MSLILLYFLPFGKYDTVYSMKEEEKDCINVPEKNLPITPLSVEEINDSIYRRISHIEDEFGRGFNFIKNHPKSVSIFGSSVFSEGNPYYEQARSLGKRIASELGYSVLTGGGPGIMEAGNRGAQEGGGHSLGLTIRLPREQATNPYVTDHVDFYYFFVRKVCLSFAAEAYVFFPGGYGTMDEFFEILTLVQTKKIEPVPIICVGSEYWNKLKGFIESELLNSGAIEQNDIDLFTITDNEDEILEIIKKTPVTNGISFKIKSPKKNKGLFSWFGKK
jgi:uncharacterized protein (TIGR00730 family)